MKRKLSAVLLALTLAASAFSMGVYAEETEAVETEQVTEVAAEEAEAVETEQMTEAAAEEAETEMASVEDQIKMILSSNLSQLSAMTDEQLDMMLESGDMSSEAIAANWKSVKTELGTFVEVTEATMNADGTEITGTAVYDKVEEGTAVTVSYKINAETGTATMNWNIDYPLSVLLKQAGLNTLMGLGIVFVTLAFLAWLIGRLHIIPELLNKKSKKAEPAAAPAPAAAAPVVEEEEYVDDLELVAVITAAIAASENTSSDGFVVRSIKKANKRNWQRA